MKNKQYLHYTILLIVSLIAFWQLAFGVYTIPGCSIFHDFPIHFFNSECLRNGYLPLWNPYSALGFSQHSNPQTWYPISLIFEVLFDYKLVILQIEIVLQIFLAGIGCYYLARTLKLSPDVSLFCGITYMLSGFFVASPMWPGWIVSGTWIPFVIGSYIKIVRDKSLWSVLALTLSYFMLFSGGYLAFFIITGYVLLGILIYTILKELINKQIGLFWKTIKLNALFVIFFSLCSLVIVIGYYDLKNELFRSGKLPLEFALYGSVTLKSLISLLFPYPVINGGDQWGDLGTISNSYLGLFSIALLVTVPIWWKNKNARLLFLMALFFMSISLGYDLPVKKWLYYIVPFLGYFMYNGMFRLFALIAFILVAGITLQEIIINPKKENIFKKFIYVLTGLIFVLFVITLILNKFKIQISLDIDIITQMNLSQSLLANSIISLIILSGFLLAVRLKKVHLTYIVIIFSTIDLIAMSQMNASGTIHSKTRVANLQSELKGLPGGIPIPYISIPMNSEENLGYELPSIEHNKSIFRKQPSYFGSNSFGYSDYTFLNEYVSNDVKEAIIGNNLVYFPDSIFSFKKPFKLNVTNYTEADSMNYAIKTLNVNKNSDIEIAEFKPNSITLNCKSDTNRFLVFMQNYFTGWKAYINDNETRIENVNFCMMGIEVPKGDNKVTFKYWPNKIIVAMWISLISFLLTITGLIILKQKWKMLSS